MQKNAKSGFFLAPTQKSNNGSGYYFLRRGATQTSKPAALLLDSWCNAALAFKAKFFELRKSRKSGHFGSESEVQVGEELTFHLSLWVYI